MLSSNKPDCHLQLPKPNLKILLIYLRETAFPSNIMHQPGFSDCFLDQNFKYFLYNQIWWWKLSGTISQPAVHRCLQPFTEKRLFMSILFNKVAGLQPKKRLGRDVFQWVCLIFQNTFFGKHVLVVTAFAKHHFLRCVELISKILLSTLVMFWLSLNIFRGNTVSCC